MNQLSLSQFLQTAPAPIHFLRNNPLKKLANLHHITPESWIPTTHRVTDYPQACFVVTITYGNPKVFFNAHRVWTWTGWQNRKTPTHDWWYEISPSTVKKEDTEELIYSFHLVKEIQTALVNYHQESSL